ncbi:MAG: transcriptional repressor LexA [Candidatus Omnitrophica bacterium]|nr:transcriptional repressor LexA [Candidatus Omnitrophota bacterium]
MKLLVKITPKQQKVLDFIQDKINKDNLPPTIREIAAALGFSSTGTVRDYLETLQKKGYLKRSNNKSRAIELLQSNPQKIRLISTIPAGKPNEAHEDTDNYLDFEQMFSKDAKDGIFALKVKGDSMIDAGIMDGDIAIIRKQLTADTGDIIAALLEYNEVTLKRLQRKDNKFYLEAANKNYVPIHKDFSILGKLIAILRNYEPVRI